ncbi:hypothetical protein WR25_24238 [Diploscapter pachys]|uniref:E3 ubiquitin-protein ligase n=1 Tax=Diploscapter pachys TaxID=2018661 RepID=A0A2A2LL82_9BILA|nr:hypothetical protein WR25_24238 [Diploscapter pachys]
MSDTSNPPPDPDSEDSQMDDENETDLEGEAEEDEDMDREMDGDTEGTEGEGDDDSMHEVEREEAPSERHRIRLDENLMRMVEGLQSTDEQRQAEAADQLAAVLLMANEDTLPPHLPAREMTDALMGMLRKEHNFELMLVAALCLRNLLEAFPRAHSVVDQATPILLHKMRSIECIDIAEQALVTLEDLSRRNHAKAIMINDGISACIEHIDFFPLSSQRLDFRLAANCAAFLSPLHFHLVKQQLPQLSERLFCGQSFLPPFRLHSSFNVLAEDGKCLESICQFFSRLVENAKYDPQKLREIAGKNHRLLVIVQQLLSTHQSSNHLPAPIFFSLLRMVHSMTRSCPDLAAALILLDYHTTLKTLLVKNPSGKEELNTDKNTEELAERPVEQLEDLVALAAELSPSLPSSNIFQIDELAFAQLKSSPPVVWFWKDDSQQWNPFRSEAIPSLERGKTAGANRIVLEMGENVYFLNLDAMTQMNATSGKIRQIKREISRNDGEESNEEIEEEETGKGSGRSCKWTGKWEWGRRADCCQDKEEEQSREGISHMQFFLISATTSGLPSRFSSFAPMSSAVQMTPSAENASTALSIRNIDRIKVWIREQAEQIMQQHFKEEENGSVLEALNQIAKKLSSRNEDGGIDPILQLYNTLKQLHDNGGIASGGGGNEILRGTQAVRHIQTNQIKLTLRRHPDCKDLQEYRREGSSSIKIDGLASVHSIERFLCQKGITQMEGQAEQAAVGAEERNRRRNVGVQIMIDNTPLPSDWSVLQGLVAHVQPPLGQSLGAFLLLRSHQLFYRSVPPSEQTQTPFSANPKVLAKDTAMKCDKAINDKIWKGLKRFCPLLIILTKH